MKKAILLWPRNIYGLALMATTMAMAACKSTPTTPTVPKTPTAQSITVTSISDMLYIGISETFTATVAMSDGTAKAITGGCGVRTLLTSPRWSLPLGRLPS